MNLTHTQKMKTIKLATSALPTSCQFLVKHSSGTATIQTYSRPLSHRHHSTSSWWISTSETCAVCSWWFYLLHRPSPKNGQIVTSCHWNGWLRSWSFGMMIQKNIKINIVNVDVDVNVRCKKWKFSRSAHRQGFSMMSIASKFAINFILKSTVTFASSSRTGNDFVPMFGSLF